MQAQSYGDFSLALHQRVLAKRIPVNGTIEVTRRCPLSCSHCYNNLPMDDQQARQEELSFEEHCRLLDELAEAGCLWLLFTGGEILARRDFLDIYTYAKKKGFFITLFTNGTLITPKVADYLAQWRPFAIEITLYGYKKETYELLTGVPGSYDRCMRGIALLLERGLPLKLKTVGVSLTKNEIWDMKSFAQELGCEFMFDAMINPRIDCSQSPLAVRLTPQEVVELDLHDEDRVTEWRRFTAQFNGPTPHPQGQEDELYHCGGGVNSFAIDPYGKMSICVLSHFDTYDLRQGSFREGWESFLFKVRQKRITRPTKCTTCQLTAMCGMCPANGELENGDPEKPVDFLCHVAHLRATALDLGVPAHGDCEYCAGGSGYETLMAEAEALKSGTVIPQPISFPVAASSKRSGCSSGGCSSCSVAMSS